jgi:hypothetical protein
VHVIHPKTKVPVLMYADDIVLLSNCAKRLSKALDLLGKGLSVNMQMTQVVVFNDTDIATAGEFCIPRPDGTSSEQLYIFGGRYAHCLFSLSLDGLL